MRKFRRGIAIGCTHGAYADPNALAAVLDFCKRWKPEIRIHLGDICDFAAFRTGARGTKDEAAAIGPDIQAGVEFLRAYRPTDVLIGNHDARVWKLADHPSKIIAHAASCVRRELIDCCRKINARLVDHYDVRRSRITYGGCSFLHGWWFNEMAVRDTAEHFGQVVMAHLHRVDQQRARRSDTAIGYSVGTLADIDKLEYAHNRRATARWEHGLAMFEASNTECHVNLSRCDAGKARRWHLPL